MNVKNLLFTALATILSASYAIAQPTIQWQKCLGGSGNDRSFDIQKTIDGGYILAGSSDSNDDDVSINHGDIDYWVVKINSIGTIEWQKSFGGSGRDYANSIQQTSDGGYIVAGSSVSNDGDVSGNHSLGEDYWVVKLTSLGTIEWQKAFGGSGFDYSYSIKQTSDGGYIVAGTSNSNDGDVSDNHGDDDYWVVKLNSIGTIEWQKSIGGSGFDRAKSMQQTSDGGYIVAGTSDSNDGDVSLNNGYEDYLVVKLTSIGTIEWQKSLGGSGRDYANSIQQTSDGGYIVAGSSVSNDGDVSGNNGGVDSWMVKLTITGTMEWQKALGGTDLDYSYSIKQTSDGGYIVTGESISNDGDVSGNHGENDYWVVKLSDGQLSIENSEPELFSVFPNPAQNTINIKADYKLIRKPYTIYDNIGKVVLSGKISSENTAIEIGNLSAGSYLFSVGDNLQQTFKVIKE